MSTTFRECGQPEYDLLAELIAEHRTDIEHRTVKITLLFAESDAESGKPAMKSRGQAVAGKAQVNSVQDRAEGKADATITLDFEGWTTRSPKRRKALLHHELSHIGTDPDFKTDSLNRPLLHLVHGDWENDGFVHIAKLYGEDAPEVRYLRVVEQKIGQMLLPYLDGVQASDGPVTESDLIRDTFAALVTVGHTEDQARAAIDRAVATGKTFKTVAEAIDAIYQMSRDAAADVTTPATSGNGKPGRAAAKTKPGRKTVNA